VALTPEGQIARYFYGIEYAPRDVRLGLVEAADNQIGSLVDQVLLYCFHYDPVVGKYSAAAMNILRLAAAATVIALGSFLIVQWRRDRRRRALAEGV
jgi:protein SCO1/2